METDRLLAAPGMVSMDQAPVWWRWERKQHADGRWLRTLDDEQIEFKAGGQTTIGVDIDIHNKQLIQDYCGFQKK